jgi:ribosomal-protein-alanine N-acetyltransferase
MILIAQVTTAEPPKVVGFAVFQRVSDEAELHNLAVNPTYRRQGVARALLQEGIRKLREAGAHRVFLEVRASNLPAIGLYTSVGFILHSTRQSYYQNPVEDALVMALDFIPASRISSH